MRPLTFLAVAVVWAQGCAPPPVVSRPDAACTGEGLGACDDLSPTALICTNGRYAVFSDCMGPAGCQRDGGTLACDTSGNSVGHSCASTSENKVRCEPDAGANILRCLGGVLRVEFQCPAPSRCDYDSDAGVLTCR